MKRSDVKALVITGFGLNCEKETAAACKYAGATPEQIHLNHLGMGACFHANFFAIFLMVS